MPTHPASPARPAGLRRAALLLLLGVTAGCGGGGGAGEGGHDDRLAALAVSAGELVPAFSPDIHTYSLDVGGLAAGLLLTPTALEPGTVIRVDGDEVPSADLSDPVPVPPDGVTPILVTTVAGDGVSASSYTVLVLRAQFEAATLQAYLKKHAHVTDALGQRYDSDHLFGFSVAVSGDTLVAGAPLESGSGAGVNPPVGGVSAASGAAYVFVRSNGSWSQQAYLKAPQPGAGDQFGRAVAVSGDRILIGAPYEGSSQSGPHGLGTTFDDTMPDAGAACVFVIGPPWGPGLYVKAHVPDADDSFGVSVAFSGDTLVVGALNVQSIALGVNGNAADNTGPALGAAYVYR